MVPALTVLVGEFTGKNTPKIQALGWGRMWIARGRNIYTYPGEPWGFDNGAFRDWASGKPFDGPAYRVCLGKVLAHDSEPYLAVLPDIPGGGHESLGLSFAWWEQLTREGVTLPWYLAVQDGLEPHDLEGWTDTLSGIFLGGTDSYKARAGEWSAWAHTHGLRFHYGRAGTMEKIAHAIEVGADSLDSALPMWTRARWNAFTEAITYGPPQRDCFRHPLTNSVVSLPLEGK